MIYLDCQRLIRSDLSAFDAEVEGVVQAALEILSFFTNHDPNHHSHLSYRSFSDIFREHVPSNAALLIALNYLCGSRVPLLEALFELYDSKLKEFIGIEPEAIYDAEFSDFLVHPDTGELIDDYENKVFIYYKPMNLAWELYANRS